VSDAPAWVDLLDPDEATLRAALPDGVHAASVERILLTGIEARPRLEARGNYVFGVLMYPVPSDAGIDFLEIDVIASPGTFVTVRSGPPGSSIPGIDTVRDHSNRVGESPGMCLFHLIDQIAEQFLDIIDVYDERIETLEDEISTLAAADVRRRIADYRHDMLHVRRMLTPTRDAARSVLDDRVELDEAATLFPRSTELHFADAYDKLLRATDDLDLTRDLLAGVRDYHQAEIANEQNDIVKRLTAIASLLLLPTFIVGLYGQNFIKSMPELRWKYGYQWSWTLIIVTTILQFWYFRRKRWI